MTKKYWITGLIIILVGVIAVTIYYLAGEKKTPPARIKIPTVFKSHMIMYARSEANIYAKPNENSEIVKKLTADEKLFIDQPQEGWFPVYKSQVDSIKNLERNRIGYIREDLLISTSTAIRRKFVDGLREKFKSENKDVYISLKNNDTLLLINHSSFDETWVRGFISTPAFLEMRHLGFTDFIVTNGRGFERRWKFN
jgi:hypothetical protein